MLESVMEGIHESDQVFKHPTADFQNYGFFIEIYLRIPVICFLCVYSSSGDAIHASKYQAPCGYVINSVTSFSYVL